MNSTEHIQRKRRFWLYFILFIFLSFAGIAQNKTITGKVTDANTGEGLPGVNVVIKGTTQGTATNIDGSFTLSVPQSGGVISKLLQ